MGNLQYLPKVIAYISSILVIAGHGSVWTYLLDKNEVKVKNSLPLPSHYLYVVRLLCSLYKLDAGFIHPMLHRLFDDIHASF